MTPGTWMVRGLVGLAAAVFVPGCEGPLGDEITATPSPGAETPTLEPTLEPTLQPTLEPTPTATDAPDVTPTPVTETPTTAPSPTPTSPPIVYQFEDCSAIKRDFWVWDTSVMPPRSVLVPTTCRLTGPNAYTYVADDQWETYVTLEMVEEFLFAFEYEAAADALYPNRGIFDNDRLVFGDIPDTLDDDPRMYVLLVDIPDYVNSEGEVFSFDGYFNVYDQLTDERAQATTLGLYHSNEVEMLYLNSRIRPVTAEYTLGVAAHELQHLIAYGHDTSEEIWMSESLAEVAMLVCGYFTDSGWVQRYASNPAVPLVTNTASGSYGAYLLWGMYLYEQLGSDFMLDLQAEQQDGITGLNRALRSAGFDTDFDALFSDWVVANSLQDLTVGGGRYGYRFSGALPELAVATAMTGNGGTWEGGLEAFGADYVDLSSITAGKTLTVRSPLPDALLVRLITYGPSGASVSTPRANSEGDRSVTLEGGRDYAYTVVISHVDAREIDTGTLLSYQLSVN